MAATDAAQRWRVEPGAELDLAAIDPASKEGAPGDKLETRAATDRLREELAEWQTRLWAESRQALLVVLQAMDAGGKDGAIRKVFSGLNPQGIRVESFKAPTEEELGHDFLWRVHRRTPRHGEIAIFNRSHYEDVLVVRVQGIVEPEVWQERYDLITGFERTLAHARVRVVKFFLHISKEEQAARLQARLDDPAKRFKFRVGDLADRARWGDFQDAYRDAISKTSTAAAPWYVIPADHKWHRDWAVATTLVEELRAMDPRYPEPEENLEGVVIE